MSPTSTGGRPRTWTSSSRAPNLPICRSSGPRSSTSSSTSRPRRPLASPSRSPSCGRPPRSSSSSAALSCGGSLQVAAAEGEDSGGEEEEGVGEGPGDEGRGGRRGGGKGDAEAAAG